jgi:DNA-binding response OmpR family regulator
MKKILVVDDEPMSHQLVSAVLRVLGDIEIQQAHTGAEGLAKAQADPPDLVISDINMPDMDGLTLCQRIRETPELADALILLLTARGEAQDKYEGFLLGADDYMTKPFDVMELQLRIKALLRRGKSERGESRRADGTLSAGRLTLEPGRFVAKLADKEVRLTGTELAIMKYFVTHPDTIVSAETLLNQALDYPSGVGNPQVIHTHLKNIRAKFRNAGVELGFLTSSWQGYCFETGAP